MRTIYTFMLLITFSVFSNVGHASWAQLLEDCGGHENHFELAEEQEHDSEDELSSSNSNPNQSDKDTDQDS